MKKIKLIITFITLSALIVFAIIIAYERYSSLKNTMKIQSSIFQLVELKSANTQWDFELNRIHSDNFPHFDLVNEAAIKYQEEMKLFMNVSKSIQGSIYATTTTLARLSSLKKERMNAYLSEIALTRNSLTFLDTLLFSLHSKYKDDQAIIQFLAYAQYQLSGLIALNQNIFMKEQVYNGDCNSCNEKQNQAVRKVNQHLSILRDRIILSQSSRQAFYDPEHAKLLAQLFEDLSLIYVKADTKHQTVQSQVLTFTIILIATVATLLVLLYWLYRTIDGHRKAGITDPLTGLYNRKKLFESLQHQIPLHEKSGSKLALLFIDLDGFKSVNDTHGHNVGDKLLKRLSARLISGVRKQDSIYRIGGDEFIILVQELHNPEDAVFIAEALLKKCSKPYKLHKCRCTVTLSIGISLFPEHAQDPKNLLKYADEAMYTSKNKGKNMATIWSQQ